MVKCPKCGENARIVWTSKDGKTVAIKCSRKHQHGFINKASTHPIPRFVKDLVFLVKVK